MNQITGTPAYWKKFHSKVLTMVKQLGCPTFFLTLSCTELRLNDLVEIIGKLTNMNMQIWIFFHRCKILNSNPVAVARHFQYQVEVFFREIVLILSEPLSNVKYFVIWVEFQVKGSPYIHSFLCVKYWGQYWYL